MPANHCSHLPLAPPNLLSVTGPRWGPRRALSQQVAGCEVKEGRCGVWVRPSISNLSRARAPAPLSTLRLYSHVRRLPPLHPARLPLLQDQRAWTRTEDGIGSSLEPGHSRFSKDTPNRRILRTLALELDSSESKARFFHYLGKQSPFSGPQVPLCKFGFILY